MEMKLHIPVETEIVIPMCALCHHQGTWEEPEKFNTERFGGPTNNNRHPFQQEAVRSRAQKVHWNGIRPSGDQDLTGTSPDEVHIRAIIRDTIRDTNSFHLSYSSGVGLVIRTNDMT